MCSVYAITHSPDLNSNVENPISLAQLDVGS